MPKKILFHNPLSPGDVVVSSALIRDLHRQYPGKYETGYRGTVSEYFWYSPYISKMDRNDPEVEQWRMTYELIHRSNQEHVHFLQGYYKDFNEKFGLNVKLSEFRPDVHFSGWELENPIISGKYWVIASGGKKDFVAKWWDPARWQQVVNKLKGEVQFVQVGEKGHYHPALDGVLDMRGKTSFRDLLRLILHSSGVCCVVTCLMHLAAACNRPCVVVAGGREPWWWEAYTRANRDKIMRDIYGEAWKPVQPDIMVDHVFLHTQGKYNLSCCKNGGCWKGKVADGDKKSRCKHVMQGPTIKQPKCLMHIAPEQVVAGVKFYEENGYTVKNEFVPSQKEKCSVGVRDTRQDLDVSAMNPPVTVCTLLYGPYSELHKRVVNSVINNTRPEAYEFRIGLNEVCKETKTFLEKTHDAHPNIQFTLFDSPENIKKYPMMRRMFHGEKKLNSEWLVWLDDDSHIVANDWLQRLSHAIRDHYERGYVMYGKRYFYDLSPRHIEWFKSASWYGDKPFDTREKTDKNGKRVRVARAHFATGGFWAIHVPWLQKYNWPDDRIYHNGGDVAMGEAIHQTGFDIKNWEYGVKISDAKRRGFSEGILKGGK